MVRGAGMVGSDSDSESESDVGSDDSLVDGEEGASASVEGLPLPSLVLTRLSGGVCVLSFAMVLCGCCEVEENDVLVRELFGYLAANEGPMRGRGADLAVCQRGNAHGEENIHDNYYVALEGVHRGLENPQYWPGLESMMLNVL